MTAPSAPGFRLLGVAVAAALVLLSWHEAATRAAAAAKVERLVTSTGLARRSPELARRARREVDPYWGRLAVARALVAEAGDPAPFASLPPREAALELGRTGERLELARRLAAAAAARRPVVWQAPLLVGAATYFERSRAGAARLLTEAAGWRAPLERAAALAPGSSEPLRFLAAADLETWPALSAAERAAARRTIAGAFADPATFARLGGTWLAVAGSRAAAFALVPDRVESWRVVEDWARRRRDWETYCAAAEHGDRALARDATARLADVEARIAGGDGPGARAEVLSLLTLAPPDRTQAETVRRALAVCPPGAPTPASDRAFVPWLRWAVAAFARGAELLPPAAVGRLLEGSSGLEQPVRALALLASDHLAEAEALDRRAEDLNTERWAPYGLAKARVLADRGELDGARAALAVVHPAWRTLPEAVSLAERLGVAERAPRPAASWPATAWRWHGDAVWLDAVPRQPAAALAVDVLKAPRDGAVAEVAVDFRRAWRGPVRPGATITVPLESATAGSPLVVTLRSVAGGRVVPGEARLGEAS